MDDEMRIESKFTTGLLSRLIEKVLSKKLGYDIHIDLNSIRVAVDNGTAYLHIDADARTESKNIKDILDNIG